MRENKIKDYNKKLVISGFMLALGLILPYVLAHGLGIKGTVLLPMHIPVFLCGFLCGWKYAGILGFTLPYINGVLTGMPVIYPTAILMSLELTVYGLITGLLYYKTPLRKYKLGMYPAMLSAMVAGRAVYGLSMRVFLHFDESLKAATVIASLITGLPGIIVQLIVVPTIAMTVLSYPRNKHKDAVSSAVNLILEESASCVLIKDNVIEKTVNARGIAPVIKLYEGGLLENAYIVDKIVGKAAAMVMTLGGVKGCYGVTMSRAAVEWFNSHGVSVRYNKLTEYIVNRQGDGICPMEETVKDINDENEAYAALKAKIAELTAGGESPLTNGDDFV